MASLTLGTSCRTSNWIPLWLPIALSTYGLIAVKDIANANMGLMESNALRDTYQL